jgi:endonuclease YncB( thermonuclease family)
MKVATHLVAAEAAWFATSALFEIDYGVGAIAAAAAASLVPDIDYPKSWTGHLLGPLSKKLNELAGHRSFFHGVLGWAVFGFLLYPLWFHDPVLWWAAVIGYGSHLGVDMMTLGGVQLFWPSDLICVFPGRDEYRIKSGTSQERVFFALVLALALVLYPISQAGVSKLIGGIGPAQEVWVKVTRVIDGDTVEVDLLGEKEKVRLIGVDSPETVAPNQAVGCYGPEASRFAKGKLEGKVVKLSRPSFGDPRDAYGRLLTYVWVDLDGDKRLELFNRELLVRGYARVTGFNHDLRREFLRAERRARAEGRGLWGICQ